MEVLRPGPLTTVQDGGRRGRQHLGVPVSGPMDEIAHRLANLLVGNPADAAVLEITLQGPSLLIERDVTLALAGADLPARADGAVLPADRPVRVRAGTRLDIGSARTGCRAYLAVAGGIDVPVVLGSRATCLRGGFGGVEGRALRKGDRLGFASPEAEPWPLLVEALRRTRAPIVGPRWHLPGLGWRFPPGDKHVRIVPGRHWDRFTGGSRASFVTTPYRVTPASDRMGYRLAGKPLEVRRRFEAISEPIAFGTLQVPHDGQPIVLMADHQTTGGYPRIAEVASVDLPVVGQLRPGDRIRFEVIGVDAAQGLYLERERALTALGRAIARRRHE